jgi:predicted CopG family antitoxin
MNTTISIPVALRENLKEYGIKGETYSDIIQRLVENAKETQLQRLLMDDSNTIDAVTALKKAKKRWQK